MQALPIYLDYAATTPCDLIVLDEMMPYIIEKFGNPSSLHAFGEDALEALDVARKRIASVINASPDEIIFTSGATESSGIAIQRVMKRLLEKDKKNHFITFKSEHKSVLDNAMILKNSGFDVSLLDVLQDGLIDIQDFASRIHEKTALVSVCVVNNETGVLQDIKKICSICREMGVLLHVDATQAFGKIELDSQDFDFMSASAHKIYGPKGVGILFASKKHQRLLRMPNSNNDIEFGVRAGTSPVFLCVGFGKAAQIANENLLLNLDNIKVMREFFIEQMKSKLSEIYVNGSETSNYPGIINISIRGCEGEAIMMEASRIAVASGSACTSNKLSISHVLDAMQIKADIAQSSIRLTIGKNTTMDDISIAIEDLTKAAEKLRAMSPIWDMINSGIDIDSIFANKEHHHEI